MAKKCQEKSFATQRGRLIRVKAKPICEQEKLVRVRSLDPDQPSQKCSTIGAEGEVCVRKNSKKDQEICGEGARRSKDQRAKKMQILEKMKLDGETAS